MMIALMLLGFLLMAAMLAIMLGCVRFWVGWDCDSEVFYGTEHQGVAPSAALANKPHRQRRTR